MRYCKDCTWYRPDRSFIFWIAGLFGDNAKHKFAKCAYGALRHPDGLVHPQLTADRNYCSVAREFSCGADAKHFEQRLV